MTGLNEIIAIWTESSIRLFIYSLSDNLFNAILFLTIILSVTYYILSTFMIFHKKRRNDNILEDKDMPSVTIQIPTYNELAAIECAKRCLEFDYPKDKYNILIGDDSNKPEISRMLKKFADNHDKVSIIKREQNIGYKPGNLNNMLKHSIGDIIIVFDSDFLPESDFLRRIVVPFNDDENIVGVQARWGVIQPFRNAVSTLATTIVHVVHQVVLPFVDRTVRVSFLCGSAEAVRKDVLIKLGGWQSGSLTEDVEYSFRSLKHGYKIKYLEDLECKCEVPYTPRDMYKQQMRWAYGVIRAYLDHGMGIVKTKKLTIKEKLSTVIVCSGYILSFLLLCLTVTGLISFLTRTPEAINVGEFLLDISKNILLTSGFLFSGAIALMKVDDMKKTFKMLGSAFSYGIITTYYVNVGIIKAIFKKPMKWYMLNKVGNNIVISNNN